MTQCNICLELFDDVSLSNKFEKNIRFKIIERCFLPFLETSKTSFLVEFMVQRYSYLMKYLTNKTATTGVEKMMSIMEKTAVFNIIEILLRKVPTDVFKQEIHKRIIGEDTKNNEITRKLVMLCHNSKKARHPQQNEIRGDYPNNTAKREIIDKEFINFYRSAYNCLGSLLLKTQTKIGPFIQFLLTKSKKNLNEVLYENLIEKDFKFKFQVETNFKTELLSEYYNSRNYDDVTGSKDGASKGESKRKRFSSFALKIAEDSLFTQTISKGRILPEGFQSGNMTTAKASFKPKNTNEVLGIIGEVRETLEQEDGFNSQTYKKQMEQTAAKDSLAKSSNENLELEMDVLNKLGPMRTLVRVLDFCTKKHTESIGFGAMETEIGNDETKLPKFIKPFFDVLKNPLIYPSIKIFVLKLIINRPKIFKPFKLFFNEFLLNYLCLDP